MDMDVLQNLLNCPGLDATVIFLGLWAMFIVAGLVACAAVCWSRMR